MSPINITPINASTFQRKYGTLSSYAQRFIKSQIQTVSYAFERFFAEIDSKIILQKSQKLEEIGVKQIGKNVEEGFVISDNEYDYHMFLSQDGFLGFDIIKSDTGEICRHFSVNDKSNDYIQAGDYSGLNFEDEISKVLDLIDGKLYKAKSECTLRENQQPFIQDQTTLDKIAKLKKVLGGRKKNFDIKKIGFIGEKEEELIESINQKHILIQELYKKISDLRTKYEVKSSYKNYLAQSVANQLGFKNIGPKGESISLFNTSYKKNAHTAITIADESGKELKFVISNDNGSVRKNLPSKFVRSENSGYRICLTPRYYTQNEIDESNLHTYLDCLNKEMEQYIEYTQNWFKKKEEIRLIKSNYDTPTMDQYKDVLDDIHSNFELYRAKMRKYLRKPHKSRKFKAENNISTKLASIAVKFDNITPEGYDLRLSYPKVKDKIATQLLVMRGDNIEKSFYILNNKLLRFNIKDLNDKFSHYDANLYYYDNKYLQESNLHNYLLLIQDKLHELNKKLDVIRKKQIKNRIRYHIKTSAEK